jgi:hypothetical protein
MTGPKTRGRGVPSRWGLAGVLLALLLTAHGAERQALAPAAVGAAPPGALVPRFSAPNGCRNATLLPYPAAGFPRVLPLTRFCPFEPRTDCFGEFVPGRSRISVREKVADPRKDTVKWKLKKGEAVAPADLGDPTVDTDYELCVYVEIAGVCWLMLHPDALAGVGWKARKNGFVFKMKRGKHPEGLRKVRVRSGADRKVRMVVKGKGDLLDLRTLPIPAGGSVLVQLYNGVDRCWSTEFGVTPLLNTPKRFKDRSDVLP